MSKFKIILVKSAGTVHCSSSDDGQHVYELINEQLKQGHEVEISFAGVEDLTTAFLNSAIGQLYKDYSEEDLKARMNVSNYEQDDLVILKRVVDRAKGFFKDPDLHKGATDEALGGKDE